MCYRAAMVRYRIRLFGRPEGRWWPTREQAEESAIKKHLGSRDEHSRIVYLSPGVAIEQDPPPDYEVVPGRGTMRRR